MPAINRIAAFQDEMTAWRRNLHQHPELAFQEVRTSAFVAEKLAGWGIEVHRGLAGTGVVGVLHGAAGPGRRAVGLRADMDALPMGEANGFDHISQEPGRMHACGHDGHTTMLLGAARYLAETRNFDGTVHFIFQPGEEVVESGARRMVEEGLFRRFNCDAIYALHNFPILPVGQAAVRGGPMMAAADDLFIEVHGVGGHASAPHYAVDPVPVACELVLALQRVVSRSVDPLEACVVSVTMLQAGSATNIIPDLVKLSGTVRTLKPEIRAKAEAEIKRICDGLGAAHGCRVEMTFQYGHPPTTNNDREAEVAGRALARVLGEDKVVRDYPPVMGGEDFAYMLRERPGAYAFLGQADGGSTAMMCHHPEYDFNDAILPLGASFFATVVEEELGRG